MERNGFEKFVAPDVETRKQITQKIKDISYYLIVGIISIITIFVVPLISGCLYGDVGFAFPTTTEGWIIYLSLRIGLALGNVAIFVMFKQQAVVNCRLDPKYIEAKQILSEIYAQSNQYKPRSPNQMNFSEYSTKGVSVFISTLASTVVISSLIISFDFITFLSCVVSTIITIIFGWVTMLNNELYWTEEYLLYAKHKKNDKEG